MPRITYVFTISHRRHGGPLKDGTPASVQHCGIARLGQNHTEGLKWPPHAYHSTSCSSSLWCQNEQIYSTINKCQILTAHKTEAFSFSWKRKANGWKLLLKGTHSSENYGFINSIIQINTTSSHMIDVVFWPQAFKLCNRKHIQV